MSEIADDYETLDHIFDWLQDHYGLGTSRAELVDVIGKLIADGYAQAYRLSPQPPYSTPVAFSRTEPESLWFYLTPIGLEELQREPAR